ncbi:MAG: hypothetical protein M3Y49_08090 [Actinomycetota bacterium]|nr:hypothetical protein [Actinomycetota bacterium]
MTTSLQDPTAGVQAARAEAGDDAKVSDYWATSRIVVAVMVAGALLVGGWPVVVASSLPAPMRVEPILAPVCGLLAGCGVLVLMTLMSRWPVLERGVGSDRLALALTWWSHRAGAGCPVCVGRDRRLGRRPQREHRGALWEVLGLPWLMSALVATLMLVVIAAVSIRAARHRMS